MSALIQEKKGICEKSGVLKDRRYIIERKKNFDVEKGKRNCTLRKGINERLSLPSTPHCNYNSQILHILYFIYVFPSLGN